MENDALMQVNSYPDLDELAKQTVLYAMANESSPDCFFEPQSKNSIFYKVYDDICKRRAITYGSYFALHLKNVYEINIPTG